MEGLNLLPHQTGGKKWGFVLLLPTQQDQEWLEDNRLGQARFSSRKEALNALREQLDPSALPLRLVMPVPKIICRKGAPRTEAGRWEVRKSKSGGWMARTSEEEPDCILCARSLAELRLRIWAMERVQNREPAR